jgi:hypothetical protein
VGLRHQGQVGARSSRSTYRHASPPRKHQKPYCLEPHDLVLAKCAAGRDRDWEFAREAIRAAVVEPEILAARGAALPLSKDERASIHTRLEAGVLAAGSSPAVPRRVPNHVPDSSELRRTLATAMARTSHKRTQSQPHQGDDVRGREVRARALNGFSKRLAQATTETGAAELFPAGSVPSRRAHPALLCDRHLAVAGFSHTKTWSVRAL